MAMGKTLSLHLPPPNWGQLSLQWGSHMLWAAPPSRGRVWGLTYGKQGKGEQESRLRARGNSGSFTGENPT